MIYWRCPIQEEKMLVANIGGSRGGAAGAALQQDPILSFSHTFLPKSAHIEGRRPPMENPGSATGKHIIYTYANLGSQNYA